mmetsp:Transcript_7168/g.11403  ORF Transcript_7168/g.11403 Transcript_7168/m.11403 type:complete len:899 (-) Transcript_7168:840-3536(-)|eukprot:CAMPEP_0203750868 /NCGR_PEP_ID=MMETSP0098-20131031/5028_1 /ASSEMBLY_ACC=CAM_ASM_000208 /TAXON_ID=96639 /ORGANISM=" , Strain NY0313808BC1" /LENGTH=898 /DNA_ID=CAMNT_0050640343 /DNA_START=351 /DNA_END=3047 /DNA_ORIENTATION=-
MNRLLNSASAGWHVSDSIRASRGLYAARRSPWGNTRFTKRRFCSKPDKPFAAKRLFDVDQNTTAAIRKRLLDAEAEISADAAKLLEKVQLNKARKQAREAFDRWRRNHTMLLLSGGAVLGSILFGGGLFLYLDYYPRAIEAYVAGKARNSFNSAESFEGRKAVYMGLPEPTLPNFREVFLGAIDDFLKSSGGDDNETSTLPSVSAETILFTWAELVEEAITQTNRAVFLQAKTDLRGRLVDEINSFPLLTDRLDAIWEIYPPSVERNLAISAQIDRHLQTGGLVSGSTMDRHRPQQPEETCDVLTAILINSIAFFPGPINKLVHFLDTPIGVGNESDRVVSDIVADLNNAVVTQDRLNKSNIIRRSSSRAAGRKLLETTGLVQPTLEKTLLSMKSLYDSLPENLQNYVLTTALITTISNLQMMPRIGGIKPYDLYVRAIEDDLIGPLRRDARITEDILHEVKNIFLAMPDDSQARVLLTAVRHPLNSMPIEDASPDAQAELARDLLGAGGVVAVKLAQMLAEHPKIPKDYQLMLGSLRDENEPMPATRFWWQVPSAVRSSITELGPCLGTGSVKQANFAKLNDGGEYAVVVLRAGVEDEALSSISALEVSDEIGPVAARLGKLVYGEFNLFGEGEVLNEFARTEIGKDPLFHVVRVKHHSPKCLVEEIAKGVSVANALESPSHSPDAEDEKTRVKNILIDYHKVVMSSFVNDGVIHSDLHLGNANYVKSGLPETDKDGFVLFDVGQFDRIGLPDTKALLWTLSAISAPTERVTLKNVAISHLAQTCSVHDKTIPKRQHDKFLKDHLNEAFEEAIAPNSEGIPPDQKTAYMLFLRASERHGIGMPNGAFSVAKMIDGIVSQQQRYELPKVVDEAIETFLRAHMTWGELADIGARKFGVK